MNRSTNESPISATGATEESQIVTIDESAITNEPLIAAIDESPFTAEESAREVGDAARAGSLWRAVDELAVAVDRLFVTELQRGLADEATVELIATALDLAAVARATRSEGAVRPSGIPHAGPDDPEVTCSG